MCLYCLFLIDKRQQCDANDILVKLACESNMCLLWSTKSLSPHDFFRIV
jgi:hypothetical protein